MDLLIQSLGWLLAAVGSSQLRVKMMNEVHFYHVVASATDGKVSSGLFFLLKIHLLEPEEGHKMDQFYRCSWLRKIKKSF